VGSSPIASTKTNLISGLIRQIAVGGINHLIVRIVPPARLSMTCLASLAPSPAPAHGSNARRFEARAPRHHVIVELHPFDRFFQNPSAQLHIVRPGRTPRKSCECPADQNDRPGAIHTALESTDSKSRGSQSMDETFETAHALIDLSRSDQFATENGDLPRAGGGLWRDRDLHSFRVIAEALRATNVERP
jgi:hypothetical protein